MSYTVLELARHYNVSKNTIKRNLETIGLPGEMVSRDAQGKLIYCDDVIIYLDEYRNTAPQDRSTAPCTAPQDEKDRSKPLQTAPSYSVNRSTDGAPSKTPIKAPTSPFKTITASEYDLLLQRIDELENELRAEKEHSKETLEKIEEHYRTELEREQKHSDNYVKQLEEASKEKEALSDALQTLKIKFESERMQNARFTAPKVMELPEPEAEGKPKKRSFFHRHRNKE